MQVPEHEASKRQTRQLSTVRVRWRYSSCIAFGQHSMQGEHGATGMLPNVHWKGVDMGLLRSNARFLALPPVQGLTLADHSSYR